jgi:hypothetical protein
MWRSEIARSAIAQNYHRYVWFAAWPLILLALFSSCGGHSGSDAGPDRTVQDEVTTYGATAVLSYLTATPGDGDRLSAIFGDLIAPPAGQQAIPLPRLSVLTSFANAKPAAQQGDWEVRVTAITTDGPSTWLVPVRASGAGYRPLQLPGLVPGLASGPAVTPNASGPIDVEADSAIAVTLRDFFDAWLTGKGDLSRVADTTAVPAFTTPPFSKVQVLEAYAGSEIPQQPQGDLTVAVIVWATKTQTSQNSYTLKLTASAGRWVVTDVSATPPVREEKN